MGISVKESSSHDSNIKSSYIRVKSTSFTSGNDSQIYPKTWSFVNPPDSTLQDVRTLNNKNTIARYKKILS